MRGSGVRPVPCPPCLFASRLFASVLVASRPFAVAHHPRSPDPVRPAAWRRVGAPQVSSARPGQGVNVQINQTEHCWRFLSAAGFLSIASFSLFRSGLSGDLKFDLSDGGPFGEPSRLLYRVKSTFKPVFSDMNRAFILLRNDAHTHTLLAHAHRAEIRVERPTRYLGFARGFDAKSSYSNGRLVVVVFFVWFPLNALLFGKCPLSGRCSRVGN